MAVVFQRYSERARQTETGTHQRARQRETVTRTHPRQTSTRTVRQQARNRQAALVQRKLSLIPSIPDQKWHWTAGGHKAACAADAPAAAAAPASPVWPHALPELELLLEEEELPEDMRTEEVRESHACHAQSAETGLLLDMNSNGYSLCSDRTVCQKEADSVESYKFHPSYFSASLCYLCLFNVSCRCVYPSLFLCLCFCRLHVCCLSSVVVFPSLSSPFLSLMFLLCLCLLLSVSLPFYPVSLSLFPFLNAHVRRAEKFGQEGRKLPSRNKELNPIFCNSFCTISHRTGNRNSSRQQLDSR